MSQVIAPNGTFQVGISRQRPEATDWTLESSHAIRMRDACALILCEKHNGALTATDREAGRLARAIEEVATGRSQASTIDGTLLARWLCKVCCGYVAMTGNDQPAGCIAHPDLIRFAFGVAPHAPVHVFFSRGSEQQPVATGHPVRIETFRTTAGGPEAYHVRLFCFDAIVATIPGEAPEMVTVFASAPGTVFQEFRQIQPLVRTGPQVRRPVGRRYNRHLRIRGRLRGV